PAPVPGARAAAPPAGRPGHASPHGAAGTAVSTACPRTHVPRGSAVTAAAHGGGGLGGRTDTRHAQQHFRFVLLDRLPVTGRPGITRAGTAQITHTPAGHQVVRGGVGHPDGDGVARAGLLTLVHRKMHEPIVGGTAGQAWTLATLLALA